MLKMITGLIAAAAISVFAATVAQGDEIVIGSAGPMTGEYAKFGEQLKKGAEQAVADLNAKGGVLGKQLRLEIGDDACDPKQAEAVARQLAEKNVVLVAGHFCSGSSIPASSVYTKAKILQITPASTNPLLTEQGYWNVFRTCGRDDQQGQIAGDYIAAHFKDKRVAIAHDKQTYSQGLADATKAALNKDGVKEVLYDTVTKGEKDFSAFVTKLKANKIDVLYYGGYHPEAALIVRQMREQGLQTQLISGDALVTDEFWKISGAAGEGTLMTFGPDPRKKQEAAAVVAEFAKAKFDPEGYTLYTYAAVQAWAQAATKAGTTDAKAVADALRGMTAQTVVGPLSYDAKGDVKQPTYVWYIWKSGTYAEM
jgi:branched-chain amino acid transport system substrate-binding protein